MVRRAYASPSAALALSAAAECNCGRCYAGEANQRGLTAAAAQAQQVGMGRHNAKPKRPGLAGPAGLGLLPALRPDPRGCACQPAAWRMFCETQACSERCRPQPECGIQPWAFFAHSAALLHALELYPNSTLQSMFFEHSVCPSDRTSRRSKAAAVNLAGSRTGAPPAGRHSPGACDQHPPQALLLVAPMAYVVVAGLPSSPTADTPSWFAARSAAPKTAAAQLWPCGSWASAAHQGIGESPPASQQRC